MKITFVMFANYFNGGNRVIAHIATELVARGHDVKILTQPFKPLSFRKRLRSFVKHGRIVRRPKPASFFASISDRVSVLETRRPVTDADVPDADVVIATWWETAAWVNALSPRKGAKVYFMQDYGAVGQELDKLIPTWWMPFSFITLNKNLKALIREQNPDAPVAIMRNAVDAAVFNAPPRQRAAAPVIGIIHRSQPTKGMDVAARAFERIRERIPNVQVIAVGDTKKGLPAWVTLVRRPTDQKLAEVFRSCNVWLFPSRMEGFGLPIIEAMACRTPVISTRVGGAEDVIKDGKNGYLVDVEDWQTMADRAVKVLTCPQAEWTAMSQSAFDTVAAHDWTDAVDVFEAELLRAHAVRPR